MQNTKKEVTHPRTEEVYVQSLRFSRDIYKIVKQFPDYEEGSGNMRGQLRRASSSVAANFAEGHCNVYLGKERDRLNSALGSVAECQCFLDLACMIGYITQEEHDKLDHDAKLIHDTLEEKILGISEILEEKEEGA